MIAPENNFAFYTPTYFGPDFMVVPAAISFVLAFVLLTFRLRGTLPWLEVSVVAAFFGIACGIAVASWTFVFLLDLDVSSRSTFVAYGISALIQFSIIWFTAAHLQRKAAHG